MVAASRLCLGASLLALCVAGCDRSPPTEPPTVEASATGVGGPTVKAPSNASAVLASESRIDVTWQDNSSNESGFEVHRSTAGANGTFTLLASTGAGVTSYGDAGLTASTQYCYKVRAFKKADGKTSYSGFSNTACATTPAPPPAPPAPTAPSGAEAKPVNSTAVDVRWIDNATNEDGFRVERSLDGGATWASVGTVAPNVTSSFDGGLASEQQACYRVIAFNAGGDSPLSNTDCTTPPAAPTGLTATGLDGPAIDLAWTDNSAVEDGYEVRRSTDGVTYSAVATLASNMTTYTDGRVSENTTYWYVVGAKKDRGYSDPSAVGSARAGVLLPPDWSAVQPEGLTLPIGLLLYGPSNTDGFEIDRCEAITCGDADFLLIATWGFSTWDFGTYYADNGVLPGTTYTYRVRAFNRAGYSPWSNLVQVTACGC